MSERILIITTGSRGNVQPFVALAMRLIKTGQEVVFATHQHFQSFIEELCPEIQLCALQGDIEKLFRSDGFAEATNRPNEDLSRFIQSLLDELQEHKKANMSLFHQRVKDFQPTCIVTGVFDYGEALAVGQKYFIPVICGVTAPVYPSNELPAIGFGEERIPFGLNKVATKLIWQAYWWDLKYNSDHFRKNELNLPEILAFPSFDSVPVLQIFSELVVPKPKDYPPQIISSGYWSLPPKEYHIDEELRNFIDECSEPPIYIGFGNMPVKEKRQILNMFGSALAKTKQHGIFCSNWNNFEGVTVPQNILLISEAPHEWLFPKCKIAFHHGGAGTTGASLLAGIPTVIVHVCFDQPFWASRIIELGVGQSKPCALRNLTADFIVEQIEYCSMERICEAARVLADKLRREDGTFTAASYVVSFATKNRNPGIKPLDYKPDSSTKVCVDCKTKFTFFNRRHHCMTCGNIFCSKCVKYFDLVNYETFRYCCRSCASLRYLDFDSQP